MRPFQILTNLDTTPKAPQPASEKATWIDFARMIGMILAAWALMALTACDMAPTQALAAADSTRLADSTGAPSKQILGAWKSVDTTDGDSLWGVAFLPTGRFVKQIPVYDGPDSCWVEYLAGTWSIGTGSIAMTYDSAGVACDSSICWYAEGKSTKTYSIVMHSDTLIMGGTTYRRVR